MTETKAPDKVIARCPKCNKEHHRATWGYQTRYFIWCDCSYLFPYDYPEVKEVKDV
jgi:hypothetical protein